MDQTQTTATLQVPDQAWQSFTPSVTGQITALEVWTGTSGAPLVTNLRFYAGEGIGGSQVGNVRAITVQPTYGWQVFVLTEPLPVTAGQTYTWYIGARSGLKFGYATGNPYANGRADVGATLDYAFRTRMNEASGLIDIRAALNGRLGTGAMELRAGGHRAMSYQYGELTSPAGSEFRFMNVLGGAEINTLAAGIRGATIAGGGKDFFTGTDYPNRVTNDFGTVGGGFGNTSGYTSVIGGGAQNTASDYTTIAGGTLNTTSGQYTFVGGGYLNTAGGYAATIAGGYANKANGARAAVTGGYANQANGNDSFVGGGTDNVATGLFSTGAGGTGNRIYGDYNTIAGGRSNTASFLYATIGGGYSNTVGGDYSSVTGGGFNIARGLFSVIGGGYNNIAGGNYSVVAGGDSNIADGSNYTTVGGGLANSATGIYSTVAGGYDNRNSGTRASIGGGESNRIGVNGLYSTVAGGVSNAANGFIATIAGGNSNTASNNYASVGGGRSNTASGLYATVTGGESNTATGSDSTIAGGQLNVATGNYGFVAGGYANTASGNYATVPGGHSNTAGSFASLAAGFRAKALHAGTFVWSDNSVDADFASTTTNQFLIRASNGVGINTSTTTGFLPGTALVVNGKVRAVEFDQSSDIRYKTHIQTVDNALNTVLNLRGVTFDWRKQAFPDMAFREGQQIGFVAQEVEKVLPQLVTTDSKGYKAVSYANVVPVLVEAMKEMESKVRRMEQRVKAVETENALLKKNAKGIDRRRNR